MLEEDDGSAISLLHNVLKNRMNWRGKKKFMTSKPVWSLSGARFKSG